MALRIRRVAALGVAAAMLYACGSSSTPTAPDPGVPDATVIAPVIEAGTQTPDVAPPSVDSGADATSSTCANGKTDGDESDVDCGGTCAPCAEGRRCAAPSDCASASCKADRCAAPSCDDGAKNGTESDVDCGGACKARCAVGKTCKVNTDCTDGSCQNGVCAPLSCTDGIKNGPESDIDCGGGCPKLCGEGKRCNLPSDCTSAACAADCSSGSCGPPTCAKCAGSDAQCGGSCPVRCALGKTCNVAGDCLSGFCSATKQCQVSPVSCLAIKTSTPAAASGLYTIDPDGPGSTAPFQVYCDMVTDGGGWTVWAYLRQPAHWDWQLFSDNGNIGDIAGGFSAGQRLQGKGLKFTEKLIIYKNLVENGASLGTQWMANARVNGVPVTFSNNVINQSGGWNYRDSYGYTIDDVPNVCSHGCDTFRGFGMFSDYVAAGYHGTQTGDNGCRDGNNICWMSRGMGCNVGDARCAYLTGNGEGVVYAVR